MEFPVDKWTTSQKSTMADAGKFNKLDDLNSTIVGYY